MENFLQPGRLAKTGIDAGAPILEQIGDMAGFPEVFVNLDPIVVMFLAWLVVILCFFVLAIQLFITLIEFKLTTLAGFVLVPFALWNKTAFLAEKVLGNVVSSGIKVLVLAVIVGIGSGLFAEFQVHPAEPSIDHALVVMLASLTCWRWASSAPASPRAWCPVRRSSARARWPVLRRRGRHGRCRRCRRDGRGRRRGRWRAHGPGCRQAGRQRRAPPRRRPAARSRRSRPVPPPPAAAKGARGPGQCRQDRRAGAGRGAASRASAAGRAAAAFRWLERRRRRQPPHRAAARAAPPPPRRRSNPPGPSACIAASNSPMPRPPPPTRCAVATAAAPAKGRACAIPIHKENTMRFKRPQVRYADTPQPATPYQAAGQVWDERIGSARVQAKNWRLMAFGCLTLALLMAGGLVWRSAQSIVTPYVIEVDNAGQVRAVGEAATPYRPSDAQIAHHLAAS
jgi:type IV secretion system protein TrbL